MISSGYDKEADYGKNADETCCLSSDSCCIAAFGDYEYQGVQYKDGIGVPSVLANMGQRPAAPVYQQPYQPAFNAQQTAPVAPEMPAQPQQMPPQPSAVEMDQRGVPAFLRRKK